jgi:hypothetical protein
MDKNDTVLQIDFKKIYIPSVLIDDKEMQYDKISGKVPRMK